MDYEQLKEVIAKKIKENGRREITGPVLQAVLLAMVDSLGEVYPQTYTDEQKAQARANIDALSNHNGEITEEKLSAEVQAILNDVANKQNITDESLATIAKTIVGAINELFNGGVKDASIGVGKLAQAVQDTLGKIGMNVKVLPEGTDLLSQQEIRETGLYLTISDGTYKNFPPFTDKSSPVLLIVTNNGTHRYAFGQKNFWLAFNFSYGSSWYGYDMENVLENKVSVVNSLTDTEVNNIWDNN